MNNETRLKLNRVSDKILFNSKSSIYLSLKFFGLALTYPDYVPINDSTQSIIHRLGTNGKLIIFNPQWVIQKFQLNDKIINRSLVHTLLHCIYRHYCNLGARINKMAWEVSCDISVEYLIDDLDSQILDNENKSSKKIRSEVYTQLLKKINILNAEQIYIELQNKSEDELRELWTHFDLDDHQFWTTNQTLVSQMKKAEEDNQMSDSKTFDEGLNNTELNYLIDSESLENVKSSWENIAAQIMVELENFDKGFGKKDSNFKRVLAVECRTKYDYRKFLKRFMILKEITKIDMEQFDYIYYSYGMELYGNMPLIEFLEYKDEKILNEFIIAIDTSGSTFGDVVDIFLRETYSAIKQAEIYRRKINLHIIQCDTRVQEDKLITNLNDFEAYMSTFNIRGGGGTDFRPVFNYVEKLKQEKKIINLKGLIYFTDGYGAFPQKKTDYETAFVFYRGNEYNNYYVPTWATKLIVGEEDFR